MALKPRRKEYHMSKTDNRPSHRVYAVTKNGERSFWQPIGAAWVHSDGWGFNVKIDYLPPQRRGNRHSQAEGRRGRRIARRSRLILRGRLRAALAANTTDSFGRAATGQLVLYLNFKELRLPKSAGEYKSGNTSSYAPPNV
jgi:hypothetical protein